MQHHEQALNTYRYKLRLHKTIGDILKNDPNVRHSIRMAERGPFVFAEGVKFPNPNPPGKHYGGKGKAQDNRRARSNASRRSKAAAKLREFKLRFNLV